VDTPLLQQMSAGALPMIESSPKIRPEEVLDSIEPALEENRLFVFPGRGTSTVWRLRRLAPALLWRRLHQVTGLA
jgi:hypothetical protein